MDKFKPRLRTVQMALVCSEVDIERLASYISNSDPERPPGMNSLLVKDPGDARRLDIQVVFNGNRRKMGEKDEEAWIKFIDEEESPDIGAAMAKWLRDEEQVLSKREKEKGLSGFDEGYKRAMQEGLRRLQSLTKAGSLADKDVTIVIEENES